MRALEGRAQERVQVGYQPSVTLLFTTGFLLVGASLVTFSFERAKGSSQSASAAFTDHVAQPTADRIDGTLRDVLTIFEVLRRLPSIKGAVVADNSRRVVAHPRLSGLHSAQ